MVSCISCSSLFAKVAQLAPAVAFYLSYWYENDISIPMYIGAISIF